MNKRWLTILLFISIAFNLAILGSFVYLHYIRPPYPRSMRQHWQQRTSSTPNGQFRPDSRFMFSDSTRAHRREFEDAKKELMLELAKDPVDTAKINAIVERSLAAQGKLERDLAEHLLRYRENMSPEEAKEHFTSRAQRMDRRRSDRRRTHPSTNTNTRRRR
ncbi:MAG: periplasmic heavy metal sensor [Candidatus Cloacimonetes bacterium]|nr:periplasmic heavy metal sensor [Candidatus Cloacimonadota bacterium]NLO10910.1 periplasmic heavy metal sensor [Candidatus Cloacimonadota bacterium]